MPFLPSTNAMVPLYHHMPFDNMNTMNQSYASGIPYNNNMGNNLWDQQALFSYNDMAPLQLHGNNGDQSSSGNTNVQNNDRLMDVFLPLQ